MQSILPRTKSRSGCPVCGSHEVMRDEVLESGALQLAECQHCEHRWTGRGDVESAWATAPRALMQARTPLFDVVLDEEGEVASAA
ncbi:MAG: hypothetical protein VCC04_08140 [Myxococcota bacterium]